MNCLCFGTLFSVIKHYSTKGTGQKEIYCYLALPLEDVDPEQIAGSSVSRYLHGEDHFPRTDRNKFIQENEEEIISSYRKSFSRFIAKDKKKQIVAAIQRLIENDASLGDDSLIGESEYTKHKILHLQIIDFESLITACMMYVCGVSNDDKEQEVNTLDENFWKDCEERARKSSFTFKSRPVPKETALERTIKQDDSFKNAFCEVKFDQKSFLKDSSSSLRVFHLNVSGHDFPLNRVAQFIYVNLGRYVFSRTKRKQYEEKDLADMIGNEAINELKKKYPSESLKDAFSEIMLYSFIEVIMHGSKILSAIELKNEFSFTGSKSSGIYLIPAGGVSDRNQIVFGCDVIFYDLGKAFEAAASKAKEINENIDEEMVSLESGAVKTPIGEKEWNYLKGILFGAGDNKKPQNSFGVFVSYSLNVPGREKMSEGEFLQALGEKMKKDIEDNTSVLAEAIEKAGLNGYPFFIFVLPLFDVDKDSVSIMERALRGGFING